MSENTNNLTGEALSRAVAEQTGWKAYSRECNGRTGWNFTNHNGRPLNYCCEDEAYLWEAYCPRYAEDANLAFTLTVVGWLLRVEEWTESSKPNSWIATYYSNTLARGVGVWGSTPAEAICRARLALHEKEGV